MFFSAQIKQLYRTVFFHMLSISKIGNIMFHSDAENIIHAFIGFHCILVWTVVIRYQVILKVP